MRLKERSPQAKRQRKICEPTFGRPGFTVRPLAGDFATDDLPDGIAPIVKGLSHRHNPAILPLLSTQILHDRFNQTVNVMTGGFDIHFEARLSHRF